MRKKAGRKPLPEGAARKNRASCYLTDDEARMLSDVARHCGMEECALIRRAVLDRLSAVTEEWGEQAAARIAEDRAHARWLRERSDPRGAVQRALRGTL